MLSFNMNRKLCVLRKVNFKFEPTPQNWIGNNQNNDYWLLALAT